MHPGGDDDDAFTGTTADAGTEHQLAVKNSCGCSATHPLRKLMIAIAEDPKFDNAIIFFIVANTLVLMQQDTNPAHCDFAGAPTDTYSSTENSIGSACEWIFFAVFLVECVCKIIAYGLYKPTGTGYLQSYWNCLDFLVVAASLLGLKLVDGQTVMPFKTTMLRMFRMLRPLKSLSKFPGLRKLITAVLNSIPKLLNVVFLLTFVLCVWAIFGLQFFLGVQHARCRLTRYPTQWPGPLTDALPAVAGNCTTADQNGCWSLYEELVLAAVAEDEDA